MRTSQLTEARCVLGKICESEKRIKAGIVVS